MISFIDSLVGPLHQNYCYYFYILALFCLVIFLLSVIACIGALFSKKKFSVQNIVGCILVPLQFLILYMLNRIMFNICRNSIN